MEVKKEKSMVLASQKSSLPKRTLNHYEETLHALSIHNRNRRKRQIPFHRSFCGMAENEQTRRCSC